MTENFNKLTPGETERLALLLEECGEVVQRVGKVLRHGYEHVNPKTKVANRISLSEEVGDVLAAIKRLRNCKELNETAINSMLISKDMSSSFLHHQDDEMKPKVILICYACEGKGFRSTKDIANDIVLHSECITCNGTGKL